MRQRDLLAAVARIDPIRVQGTFERHTSLRWEELNPSAAGGRWVRDAPTRFSTSDARAAAA